MSLSGNGSGIVRRRSVDGRLIEGGFADALPDWHGEERWLFLSPHDDDPAVSASMTLAAAVSTGVQIRVRIATDGSMGYTSAVGAAEIVARRREETLQSFSLLGIDDVDWYDYPDARLHLWRGRMPLDEAPTAPHVVAGYTGLQNSITAELRDFRPTRVLIMSDADYHPDHKTVHGEVMISIFHAQGDVWPELGPPTATVPWVHEFAAYAPFVGEPDIQFAGSAAVFERKLAAIEAFSSQTQIARLVDAVRVAGPQEYMRSYPFETYSPERYAGLFHQGGWPGDLDP